MESFVEINVWPYSSCVQGLASKIEGTNLCSIIQNDGQWSYSPKNPNVMKSASAKQKCGALLFHFQRMYEGYIKLGSFIERPLSMVPFFSSASKGSESTLNQSNMEVRVHRTRAATFYSICQLFAVLCGPLLHVQGQGKTKTFSICPFYFRRNVDMEDTDRLSGHFFSL